MRGASSPPTSLCANRAGVTGERIVVRKPAVRGNRRRSVEPREKRQFLQMVSEPIRAGNRRNVRSCERITYFKIILACAYLSRGKQVPASLANSQ